MNILENQLGSVEDLIEAQTTAFQYQGNKAAPSLADMKQHLATSHLIATHFLMKMVQTA